MFFVKSKSPEYEHAVLFQISNKTEHFPIPSSSTGRKQRKVITLDHDITPE